MERDFFDKVLFKSQVFLTKLYNRVKDPEQPLLFFIAANAFIEDDQGRVLVINRTDKRGLDFPGGLREKGETLEQTARREVQEETGYIVEPLGIITVLDTPNRDPRLPCLCFTFRCAIKGGELKSSAEGDAFWVDRENLKGLAFDNHLVLESIDSSNALGLYIFNPKGLSISRLIETGILRNLP